MAFVVEDCEDEVAVLDVGFVVLVDFSGPGFAEEFVLDEFVLLTG